MKIRLLAIALMSTSHLYATQVYIKNWSTSPVIINQVSEVNPDGKKISETHIAIQPGQSTQLKHLIDGQTHLNFDSIHISFTIHGYTKEEEIFFPDEETQEATLSFTDSGYKRTPHNIIKK